MQNKKTEKYKSILFYLIMAVVFLIFFVLEIFGPSERENVKSLTEMDYKGTFTWEKEDGEEQQITVPGRYEVAAGETMTISTVLPDDYSAHALAIRSSLQNVRFYVDGELREEYDTENTRPFGKNSASRYVFCETSEADAGKKVQIELTTFSSRYTGVVNEIYCGDRAEIWEQLFCTYGRSTIVGFFILFAGIITVIFSMALELVYKTRLDMEDLGWCMILGAVWMLGESKFRQILVPNASVLSILCFVSIMLGPVPLLSYMDKVQRKRYRKIYLPVEFIAYLNFFVCTALQLMGRADYIDMLPVAHVIFGLAILTSLVTIGRDIITGNAGEYRLIIIGILVALAAVAAESASVYFVVSVSGFFMGTGLLVLLVMTVIRTMKNMREVEIEKRQREEESMDFLTGLPMRMRGEKEISGRMREEEGWLILLDMDNLKRINDIYGHKAGDRALRALGEMMKNVTPGSCACRLGGDEFLLFLPGTDKGIAAEIMQGMFHSFEEKKEKDFEIQSGTLSAGLCRSRKGDRFEDCYSKADRALYYVKQNGKNQFAFYQEIAWKKQNESGKQRDLEIVAKALRESGSYMGALDLDYRDFAKIFEYMKHLGERYRHTCYLVIITMDMVQDDRTDIENTEQALECMGKAIQKNIRKVDICTRYSSMQYLVILMETEENEIPAIMQRIFEQYENLYDKNSFTLHYDFIRMMGEKKAGSRPEVSEENGIK